MRWMILGVLIGLATGAAVAQQAPSADASKSEDAEFRPTTLRLPEYDTQDRVVITGMVPIPDVGEGAPLFTAKDLEQLKSDTRRSAADTRQDQRRCGSSSRFVIPEAFNASKGPTLQNLLALEYEDGLRVAAEAGQAHSATERAEAARRDAASDKVGMDVVIALELERQAAINDLQEARAKLAETQAMIGDWQDMMLGQRGKFGITWGDLDLRALKRKKEGVGLGIAVPEEIATLDIRNVKASQHKDRKGKDIVVVRGDIVNTGAKSRRLPSLSVSLLDERGWVLTNSTVSAPGMKKSIGAGKTKAFQVEMRPAPDLLRTAVVTFAAKSAAEPRIGVGVFC